MAESNDKKTRIISYVIVGGILLTVWYMLDLVLLTFLIAFIFYHIVALLKKHCDKAMPFSVPEKLLLILSYFLFMLVLVMFISEGLPVAIGWCKRMAMVFTTFSLAEFYSTLDPRLVDFLEYMDLGSVVKSIGTWMSTKLASYSTSAVGFFINLFISIILAFIVLFEKSTIVKFGESLANSKGAYVYEYLTTFGKNFCNTFGKVMRVQVTIAFVNSILSMCALAVMGFSNIPALGVMIFTLGLIPVAGVIISLIPLSILAISLGGLTKLIEVIIMICVLHTIEAYILNPKLMSNKTNLPVSFTLIILVVGEHYLGVWGLLIGVPLFLFLMNLLEVNYEDLENGRRRRIRNSENE